MGSFGAHGWKLESDGSAHGRTSSHGHDHHHDTVFAPTPFVPIPPPFRDYDPQAMRVGMDAAVVAEKQQRILDFGSRFMGQPGVYKVQEHILETFRQAGLEIFEHDLLTAAPHTEMRRIYEVREVGNGVATNVPLDDVEIYPFFPNHLQPVVTPAQGIDGELVLLNSETLRTRRDFSDCIGLVDSTTGALDEMYDFNWTQYAQLGVKALIVGHPRGLAAAPWDAIAAQKNAMVSSVPVNYVRLAATSNIFQYVGRRIGVRVRCRFKATPNKTIIGVLRAKQPAKQALIVASCYDACSILPDHAPGALQAVYPAIQLSLLQGLLPYRDSLRRDVIFVMFGSGMMAEDGLNNLLRILHKNHEVPIINPIEAAWGIKQAHTSYAESHTESRRRRPIIERQSENLAQLKTLEELLQAFDDAGFLEQSAATQNRLDALGEEAITFFKEQFGYIMNSVVLELSEPMLDARIAFERQAVPDTESEFFQSYLRAKQRYDKAASLAGFSAANLLKKRDKDRGKARERGKSFDGDVDFVAHYAIRQRLLTWLRELRTHHRQVARRHEQELAIVGFISRYQNVVVLDPRVVPAPPDMSTDIETFSLHVDNQTALPALPSVANIFASSRLRIPRGRKVMFVPPKGREHPSMVNSHISSSPVTFASAMWSKYGYAVYTPLSFECSDSYKHYSDPCIQPFMLDLATMQGTLQVLGESVLSLTHGNGRFEPAPFKEWIDINFGGRVLVSNVGQSIVPNYPLKYAAIACRNLEGQAMFSQPGYYRNLVLIADPYGHFDLPHDAGDFPVWWRVYQKGAVHNPVAAGYDEDGMIRFIKDEGEDGQRLFKSANVPIFNRRAVQNVTIVTFRAAPITLLDLINPQTMKGYSSVGMLTQIGLAGFRKMYNDGGLDVNATYLPPDERCYVALRSGDADNELVQVTRAFLLNVNDVSKLDQDKEIDGDGYLVADNYYLLDVPGDASRSMIYVNGKRLKLQDDYAMADERTIEYHKKSQRKMAQSEDPALSMHEATKIRRDAVIYATLNHPVLRESIAEAVLGILWYLGLLVPFVFFFEKLLFCYPDIRHQLTTQAIIFLAVFSLLWMLHPAFQMVRSSLMILLGFVIILISGGITILFSSKFQENLEELRKKQGKVAAAEVNKLGVIGTAFMLGLNNMHRRKVRTGLTCATLTLLTFVMICFTSVQDNVVEEGATLGKAPYQGMLIKRDESIPLSGGEVFSFKRKFGDRFKVCEREMLVGEQGWDDNQTYNPELEASITRNGVVKKVEFDSVMMFTPHEPLRDRIVMLTTNGWFREDELKTMSSRFPVMLPAPMADELGINAESVNQGGVEITINGTVYAVFGIFEPESLTHLRDIDGRDMLPFDIESMTQVSQKKEPGLGAVIVASEEDPRILAERIVIAPVKGLFGNVVHGHKRIASAVVDMSGAGYKESRGLIETFMEQTSETLYYGLDGIAFKGRRAREINLAGLLDLIIPLILAGLTVLNTMRGSVYERRNEIYVYNAVGIAPSYVFFIFFAEAFVYAVVGAVMGYLLSQGTGRILTALNLTGGLNMTFTSISTIYASLAMAAATFASTYFPARSAMEISAPAEDAGWKLPEPEGDYLRFDLPFTFLRKGRLAILRFCERYLADHGEGSAGRFFASVPGMCLESDPSDLEDQAVPALTATIWLKPFDLAVSQQLTISIPKDPETGLFKAHVILRRMSGSRESWLRLNHGFVALVRRHFLHWRAITQEEADELFDEGRRRLVEDVTQG